MLGEAAVDLLPQAPSGSLTPIPGKALPMRSMTMCASSGSVCVDVWTPCASLFLPEGGDGHVRRVRLSKILPRSLALRQNRSTDVDIHSVHSPVPLSASAEQLCLFSLVETTCGCLSRSLSSSQRRARAERWLGGADVA